MIAPMIHRVLSRDDLACLVASIARTDREAGQAAATALEGGDTDAVLDSRAARDAVRGQGGTPAALSLPLLWYVPVRAALLERGVADRELADFTATLPVIFAATRSVRRVARGAHGLATWWRAIESLPNDTVAQGERAADCGALALWWAGCFPEAVERQGGRGAIRAYVTFTERAWRLASRIVAGLAPGAAALYQRARDQAGVLWEVLFEVRRDYLGRDATTADGRLARLLEQLGKDVRYDN